jgi:hypothetical protein
MSRQNIEAVLTYELIVFKTKEESEGPVRICCFSMNFTGTLEQAKEAAIELTKEFDSYSCAIRLDDDDILNVIV